MNTPLLKYERVLRDKIYVDKSLLIDKLNDTIGRDSCYICITRPRRFGKTINANMLGAYYTIGYDSKYLFKGLKIEKSETFSEHLNKYHVIYIDFSRLPDSCDCFKDYISWIKDRLKKDMSEAFDVQIDRADSLQDIIQKTNEQFIFILDEWDAIFYKSFMSDYDKQSYLEFLKGLLKDQPYVALAYMTGVLPIAKYSKGSELNMFKEYNFMNDYIYENYFGFDEHEVRELCSRYGSVSYEALSDWYNGYHKTDGTKLFNPRSVTSALTDGVCLNYWTETGPMNEITEVIEHNVAAVRDDIVKMISGIPVEIELNGYGATHLQLNSRDEILSAMVVFGFLSYQDHLLSIPNRELMEKFEYALKQESMGAVSQVVQQSKEMLEATLHKDTQKVAQLVENAHDDEIPLLQYNDENSMTCVITLCYLYARNYYTISREEKSGKGYADFLFKPKKEDYPAIILELKYGKSAEEAIQQIKDRNYIDKVKDRKQILLVGINYDLKSKHHTCVIEEYV